MDWATTAAMDWVTTMATAEASFGEPTTVDIVEASIVGATMADTERVGVCGNTNAWLLRAYSPGRTAVSPGKESPDWIGPKSGWPAMNRVLIPVVLIGGFLAVDIFAFDGRYTRAAWLEAQHQGQEFRANVDRWLRKLRF